MSEHDRYPGDQWESKEYFDSIAEDLGDKCPRCEGNGRVEMLEHCPACGGCGLAPPAANRRIRELTAALASRDAELAELREKLANAVTWLEEIVCTKEPDCGVILLSNESPTHWDHEAECQVYDHENFSPLGDALIALHEMLTMSLIPGTAGKEGGDAN